jgi:nucleotide-binding universal stress UspA family protein
VFKSILVPTDGSELSDKALDRALVFAKEVNAKLCVCYVKPDEPLAYYGDGAFAATSNEQFTAAAEREAQRVLQRARDRAASSGIAVDTTSPTSNWPHEAIIAAARERGCDLICMASHGRRGLRGLVLGSETVKVLTHSDIPVLVYR